MGDIQKEADGNPNEEREKPNETPVFHKEKSDA